MGDVWATSDREGRRAVRDRWPYRRPFRRAHHRGVESSRPVPQPLTAAECLELLAGCTVGRIAVVHEGYPVVLPVNFVLSRGWTGLR